MTHSSLAGVRIVLDLELFFKDKRRKCYYYVDFSRNQIVGDVCNGIKSNFDVSEDISLEVNGCYIPENEDVRVLYNEDLVRVIDAAQSTCVLHIQNGKHDGLGCIAQNAEIVSNALRDKNIKRLDKQEENENNEHIIVSMPKKRKKSRKTEETQEKKYREEGLDDSENPIKNRKHVTKLANCPPEYEKCTESKKNESEPNALNSSTVMHEVSTRKAEIYGKYEDIKMEPVPVLECEGRACDNMCSTVEFPHVQTRMLNPEVGSCVSSASLKTDDNTNGEREDGRERDDGRDAEGCEYLVDSNCKKRRRRKRRKPPKSIDQSCFVQHLTEAPVLTKSSSKTPKHIKFVDEDEEHNNYKNNIELTNACNNAFSGCVPSQYSAESESSNVDNRNSECNIQSNSNVPIANNTSIVADNSDISNNVIQVSSTPMIFECKRTNRLPYNQSVRKETETDFSKYPLLNNAPKANEIIVFKKLKIESNYCPGVSNYISAKVLQVSEKDSLVSLRILNGHQELKEPKGKFSLEEENETVGFEEHINDIIEMNLTDLLDVRLLFP